MIDSADGFEFHRGLVSPNELTSLREVFKDIPAMAGGHRWANAQLVTLLDRPLMQPVLQLAEKLAPKHKIVRIVGFQKTSEANWFVPAHQDRSVPIDPDDTPLGTQNMTKKGSGWQGEVPIAMLQSRKNIRIFVDDASEEDGPLEVLSGSHQLGRLTHSNVQTLMQERQWTALTGNAGDVVVLSPLLVHRSRRASNPSGRRVLQVECAP